MVQNYSTVQKTNIQTDNRTGQTEKNDKQTNEQTDRQYVSVVKKVGIMYPCKYLTDKSGRI
jgi:hypothetical protein